jgi:hypothetical protein
MSDTEQYARSPDAQNAKLQRHRNISVREFQSQGGAHVLQVLERPAASSTVQRVALNFRGAG